MSTQEQFNEAIKLLEKHLADKRCKLVSNRANGYRLAEAAAKSYGCAIPATATPADLEARMYSAILADTNGIISRAPGSGQLEWEIKPAKLLAYEASKEPGRLATYQSEEKKPRVPEGDSVRHENFQVMERLYDGLGYVSPRSSLLRTLINDLKDDKTSNTTEALKVVKQYIKEPSFAKAVLELQEYAGSIR
jgi:hypothetical protein